MYIYVYMLIKYNASIMSFLKNVIGYYSIQLINYM